MTTTAWVRKHTHRPRPLFLHLAPEGPGAAGTPMSRIVVSLQTPIPHRHFPSYALPEAQTISAFC